MKSSSSDLYLNAYNSYIRNEIGNKQIGKIKGVMIQSIYNEMERKRYTRNTLEVARAVLNGMFKQAFKDDIIPSNPVEKPTLPKAKETKMKDVMTKEQQQIFVDFSQKSDLHYQIVLALYTGMRTGEISRC